MREYSKVKLVVHDNTIFITDIKDGYLDYKDKDYER